MPDPTVVETECQCARCGSSIGWEDCELCPSLGFYDQPDPNCPDCHGTGSYHFCLSSMDWCIAHPNPGRENVPRGTVEWFELLSDGTTRLTPTPA